MQALLIFLLWILPTGPACCDDATDVTSCGAFDFLHEIGGSCERTLMDAELAWCDAAQQQCWALSKHVGHWRCCSDDDICVTPLGDVEVMGDLIVACEADKAPKYCDPWEALRHGEWYCAS